MDVMRRRYLLASSKIEGGSGRSQDSFVLGGDASMILAINLLPKMVRGASQVEDGGAVGHHLAHREVRRGQDDISGELDAVVQRKL